MGAEPSLRVFILAGEASGDHLGGPLMAALRRQCPVRIDFFGVGGPTMAQNSLEPLFAIEDLSVMGLVEIAPRLPLLARRLNACVAAIQARRPDAIITIDAPDFAFRLGQRLKRRGVTAPHIHYVAPTVWAWRPGRARAIAQYLDHIMTLLPFEPPYFEREGLTASYVGHPVIERNQRSTEPSEAAFRDAYAIAPSAPLLAILPGSRRAELKRLLPDFVAAAEGLRDSAPGTTIVFPTFAHFVDEIADATAHWRQPPVIVTKSGDKAAALQSARAAIAASGTVGLELAFHMVPHVVAYRVSPLTAFLARRLVRTRWVHLANIILDEAAVPELLQQDVSVPRLIAEAEALLADGPARERQLKHFARLLTVMTLDGGARPSEKAAAAVLGILNLQECQAGGQYEADQ